jgi:multiple sugar transport system ATP-binding protein
MSDLQIQGLVKRFGSFTAVDGVDIAIEDGEFVFLLGPSGCGKTTTLRMIAGLEMPTQGRIDIARRNVTYLRPRYRNVGMVFQDYGLYSHMTVFENIAYPLKVRKMTRQVIAQKVDAVSKTMKIGDVLDRMPDQLAAGQLQRVAIARMLVRDADIFLMDEPMSHLDAQLRGHMRAELRHIQKEIGTTTIFVTHDQLEAMTMADRIIVMNAGRMLQFGTPLEVFEQPADEFVATFVGEPQMNVMDARLRLSEGKPIADVGPFSISLDSSWTQTNDLKRYEGRPVRLGIRPEHIGLSSKKDRDHPVGVDLYTFEPTGPENLFVLRAGEVEITTRNPTTETVGLPKEEGTSMAVGFDPKWIYLFDAETGKTIAQAAGSSSKAELAA